METLSKYVLKEWVKAFLISLIVILFTLLVGIMYDDIVHLIEYGASLGQIVHFYFMLIPSLLHILVPVSLFLSLLFSLGSLHKNNEIVAMRAAGLSLFSITRPLWGSIFVLTFLLFYLNADLVPRSSEKATELENKMRFKKNDRVAYRARKIDGVPYPQSSNYRLRKIFFESVLDHRIWFIEQMDEKDLNLYGVEIYQKDSQGQELYRIVAQEAFFKGGMWYFKHGKEIAFDKVTHEPIFIEAFEQKQYEAINEDPHAMLYLNKKPRHLSLFQIKKILELRPDLKALNKGASDLAKYYIAYHRLLASPISCLIVFCLAVPFSISGVRTSPFVGMAKAFIVFFIYYIVLSTFSLLGGQYFISPLLAAWVPNIIFFLLGIFLWYKLR